MLLSDSKDNASSLSYTIGEYSEPYDKIIHKSNLNHSNPNVYRLYDFPKQNIFQ